MSASNYEIEQEAIKEAILKYYHEGHVKSDPELYKEILHPEWRFIILESGKLRIIERSEYFSFYNPSNADPNMKWETEFYYIDVTEHLASVKLRLECQKVKYIDYFNMMKIDGKWWIMHKMSIPINK